uniref:Uncharacterized protein n=1 Tax=Salmonella phage vB_SEnST11_KE23 TaxID=3161174 RepID=A0AAU8GEZ7_9CAUD
MKLRTAEEVFTNWGKCIIAVTGFYLVLMYGIGAYTLFIHDGMTAAEIWDRYEYLIFLLPLCAASWFGFAAGTILWWVTEVFILDPL